MYSKIIKLANMLKNVGKVNMEGEGTWTDDSYVLVRDVFLIGGTGCVSTRGFTMGTCRSSSSTALSGGAVCCTLIGWRPRRSAVHSNSVS